jgi:hypothetical protein
MTTVMGPMIRTTAHSLRVTRQERQRWAIPVALQGCRDGWTHAR